jgi:hypothetical protein
MESSIAIKKNFIQACRQGSFLDIYSPKVFATLSSDDLNHGYYHACDNDHKELAYSLHQTGKITAHNNSMAFVDASEKCNLPIAQQTYHLNHIEFSEVRWAIHKTSKNKEISKCQEVLQWLKILLPTEK